MEYHKSVACTLRRTVELCKGGVPGIEPGGEGRTGTIASHPRRDTLYSIYIYIEFTRVGRPARNKR